MEDRRESAEKLNRMYDMISNIDKNSAVLCAKLINHIENDEMSFGRIEEMLKSIKEKDLDQLKDDLENQKTKINRIMGGLTAFVFLFEFFRDWILTKLGLK